MNSFSKSSPEITDLDIVNAYCTTVLLSNDRDEIDAADNQYMDLFRTDEPHVAIRESATVMLATMVDIYSPGEKTEKRELIVDHLRLKALKHVARMCVQGNKWPIDHMSDVFYTVKAHIEGVSLNGNHITSRQARSYLRQEVRSTISSNMSDEEKKRSKRALTLLASPLSAAIQNLLHPAKPVR